MTNFVSQDMLLTFKNRSLNFYLEIDLNIKLSQKITLSYSRPFPQHFHLPSSFFHLPLPPIFPLSLLHFPLPPS